MFDDFDMEMILNILNDKIEKFKCPICGNEDFSIIDGFIRQTVSTMLNVVSCVATCCDNCGYMNFHSALKLLTKSKKEDI